MRRFTVLAFIPVSCHHPLHTVLSTTRRHMIHAPSSESHPPRLGCCFLLLVVLLCFVYFFCIFYFICISVVFCCGLLSPCALLVRSRCRDFCKWICVGTTLLYSPNSNFDSASFASSSFCLMLLVPSGGSHRFSLICTIFAFTTALCGPLRGLGYSFDPFSTLYNYFYIVLVCFWSIVREPTPFFVFRITHSIFLLDQE
jgi:hypothetical protein